MTTVLFACVHNAGRSQMAAAFFNAMADRSRATALSAGTQPADHIHPEVVTVMREAGIELDGVAPQRLTDELARNATILVTMGCGDSCPVIPGVHRMDWQLPDPKGLSADAVRAIRDDIRDRVSGLVHAQGVSR